MPPTSTKEPLDYEPVLPLNRGDGRRGFEDEGDEPFRHAADWPEGPDARTTAEVKSDARDSGGVAPSTKSGARAVLRKAHGLTYAGLLLFTLVLFYRPYEYIPLPATLAFWLAMLTFVFYFPAQLGAEGNLTARPREVNLVLLFCLAGLVSVPFAKESPGAAWDTFSSIFIRAVLIFIVIVNVVRTERRLRWLLLLAMGSGVVMAAGALSDYASGKLTVEGYRVEGRIGGIFENPNEMALHLVTLLPIAAALAVGSRGFLKKILYGAAAAVLVAGTVVTYSRGGFLAMAAVFFVLAWTLGRKNRFVVMTAAILLTIGLLIVAPGGYGARILSIYDRSLDVVGSADARQQLLMSSIIVALRNPLFGVGMGNFVFVSYRSLETHNAYTQVAAEIGAFGFAVYMLYVVTPLRRMLAVARASYEARRTSRYYYLAVGLAASLAGYMVASFFGSFAYYWNIYYLVGYAVCLRRLYEDEQAKAPEPAASES
ncbi:MAG: O-antigen ligase family protein [Pyrinomonadaceae bacterium]